RALDALRVFDLVYVLTGGGPGTATETLSIYTFTALMRHLRFGFGAALSIGVFLLTFGLAWLYIRLLGRSLTEEPT
ncbi:MAG: sugar ABC transporter permease, partial [Vicinamibacterales bacterium]